MNQWTGAGGKQHLINLVACELVVWQNRSKAGTRFGFLASCAVSACHLLLSRSSSHARDGGKCSNLRRERGDKPNSGEFPSLGWSEGLPELVHLACFGRAELRLGVGEPEEGIQGRNWRVLPWHYWRPLAWILSRLYGEATGQPLDVSPHVSVAEACRNFGRFVTFQFVEPGSKEVEGEASEPKNAFAELMRSAAAQTRSLVLPVPRNECRGDWRLFNALIHTHSLKSDGLGFSTWAASGLAETSGKEFVDALATVLFHLLIPERIERMEARGIKLPALWTNCWRTAVWRSMTPRPTNMVWEHWPRRTSFNGETCFIESSCSPGSVNSNGMESRRQHATWLLAYTSTPHTWSRPLNGWMRCTTCWSQLAVLVMDLHLSWSGSSPLHAQTSSFADTKLLKKLYHRKLSMENHSSWLTTPLLIDGSDTSCIRLWLKGRVGVSVCVQS